MKPSEIAKLQHNETDPEGKNKESSGREWETVRLRRIRGLYIKEKERDKSGCQKIQRLIIKMDLMACKMVAVSL